uniref:Uncharacterized protein n=1 Tax=Nelumbo nucifera TaxID=4432 RepID=A0A822Z2G6_NELNU|nr:TPA_asm: hypothetical protein HUJ06_007817 [Nelumbo nucifera]
MDPNQQRNFFPQNNRGCGWVRGCGGQGNFKNFQNGNPNAVRCQLYNKLYHSAIALWYRRFEEAPPYNAIVALMFHSRANNHQSRHKFFKHITLSPIQIQLDIQTLELLISSHNS